MNKIAATGPNTDQIKFWNGQAGETWVQHQEELDAMIGGIGAEVLARAQIQDGESVLDVGCGCGQTTLEIGRRVGQSGEVTGADISAPMIEHARARAVQANLSNVEFEVTDAETHPFASAAADLVFSRFGIMFFKNPVAAFTNLASALKPGGRLAFVCWRQPDENLWLVLPSKAAGGHVELPPRPEPDQPSPFAFANPDRVTSILTDAGFTEIALEQRDGPLKLGGPNTLDGAVNFAINVGPAADAYAHADGATRAKVVDSVRGSLEPFYTGSAVEMPSSAWIVTARKN